MRRKIVFIMAAVVAVWGNGFADQIHLKNGDRLTGSIVKLDQTKLSIKSELAGDLTVPWDAVDRLTSSQPLYLSLSDGQVIVGTVGGADGNIEVQTQQAGTVSVSKGVVRTIRSQGEQSAYEANTERMRNPKLGDLWSGFADAGLSLSRGNADITTLAAGMKAVRATSRDKITTYFTSLSARTKASGRSLTTADAIRGGARYDFNLSSKLFAFGLTDLEYDKLQKLDLRSVVAGGLGFHVLKTEKTLLDIFSGGAFNQEFFTDVTRRSAELLLGEELSHKLTRSMSLTQRGVFYPNLSETGEYRLAFDASAVTQLGRQLGWQVTFSDRYQSNPIPGIKKNDILLTTGIRLTFGGAGR
ncbi:MAG TPA: DUF481 domain-containing protein [Acidobacteriota bacterium]